MRPPYPGRRLGGRACGGVRVVRFAHDSSVTDRDAAYASLHALGLGAAVRVAPLGAWEADYMDAVVEQAERSAVVTHAHPEAAAGAIAVAVAAALAVRGVSGGSLVNAVVVRTPDGEVAARLRRIAEA